MTSSAAGPAKNLMFRLTRAYWAKGKKQKEIHKPTQRPPEEHLTTTVLELA